MPRQPSTKRVPAKTRGHVIDIADRQAVRDAIVKMEKIDVLINNAGLELITPIDAEGGEIEDGFRRIIDINVNGT